jgi:hypothetical protein
MQTIEFETTAFQHTVRIPDNVPDGALVRIVLSFDDATTKKTLSNKSHWKNLLGAMSNVGNDEDFSRSTDNDKTRLAEKFSTLPEKFKLSRDELNDRRPDYLTMTVNDIEIPPRDERYDR